MEELRHPPEFGDTDPRVMKVWNEILRSKTEGERIEICFHRRSGVSSMPTLV